jgi:hypothetical protein
MLLWRKTEKHVVEGRTVIFKGLNALSDAVARETRALILDFCKKSKLAKRFPSISFVVPRWVSPSHADAYMSQQDAAKGRCRVYLKHQLLEGERDEFDNKLLPSIEHELTHVLHAQSAACKRVVEKVTNLDRKLDTPSIRFRVLFSKTTAHEAYFRALRVRIARIFMTINLEGLAEFSGKSFDGQVIFERDAFAENHKRASESAEVVRDVLREDFARTDWQYKEIFLHFFRTEELIAPLPYWIGFHMAYAIAFGNVAQDVEEMAQWTDRGFIAKYEQACTILDVHPVVTLTKTSPLCYKGLLAELEEASRKATKWF